MNSNVTLTNSSQFYLANADVFLRSVPAQIKFGELSDDALRLLVYYISKAGPFELAVESGYFTGTLEEWLSSLKANLQFKGVVNEYSDLATFEGASQGDLVFVKSNNRAYIYNGDSFTDEANGISITGPSAYDIAVTNGFQGTVQDFLDSLKGENGDEGDQGLPGINGQSAYDLAVLSGFVGTVEDWLESLKGAKGDAGDAGDKGDAFTFADFTPEQLEALKGPKGNDGDKGNAFTYADFTAEQLLALKGANGEDGVDGLDGKAFTYADFTTEQLEGLKGPKGDPGTNGVDGVTQNATTIVLTGLDTIDSTDVAETDTLLQVIGKLQAQISALKSRVETLETP